MIDPSVFEDRYVKNLVATRNVQFCPKGQLLATGGSDGQVRVRSLEMNLYQSRLTLLRYGISPPIDSEPYLKDTDPVFTRSLFLLMIVIISLHAMIGPFAYGIYAMDRQRSCL